MRNQNLHRRFDFAVYGTSFGVENVRKLEEMVAKVIAAKDNVERKICDSSDIFSREEVSRIVDIILSASTMICPGGHCARGNLPRDNLYD